jgi:hypothetical protein
MCVMLLFWFIIVCSILPPLRQASAVRKKISIKDAKILCRAFIRILIIVMDSSNATMQVEFIIKNALVDCIGTIWSKIVTNHAMQNASCVVIEMWYHSFWHSYLICDTYYYSLVLYLVVCKRCFFGNKIDLMLMCNHRWEKINQWSVQLRESLWFWWKMRSFFCRPWRFPLLDWARRNREISSYIMPCFWWHGASY